MDTEALKTNPCATEAELLAYLGGTLADVDTATIADHLKTCPMCELAATQLEKLPATIDLGATHNQAGVTSTGWTTLEDGSNPPIEPPLSFPNYVLLEELGRGGMGVVYQAQQIRPSRMVALKILRVSSGPTVLRFAAESDAVARLRHPNIVQVYEVGDQHGRPFFSMELIEGGSLDQALKSGPMLPKQAAQVAQAIAHAVQHAHERGIIHRDLKAANVLLAEAAHSRDDLIPKVTDFGIAKRLDEAGGPTLDGDILGTPSYMPPEQAGGRSEKVGPTADVYSLGVILYEMLTGRVPFKGVDIFQTLLLVRTEEPVAPRMLNPKLPRDLETITLKCLEKDPNRRYASAANLAEDLRRFLGSETIEARPASSLDRAWKWSRRRPTFASAIALGLAATLALLIGGAIYNARLVEALNREKLANRAAEKSAKDASRDRKTALSSLRSLVYEVQQTLKDVPGARKARRTLLDKAIADLRNFTREADESSPDLDRLRAHREMGELYREVGETQDARLQFEACRKLGDILLARGEVEATFDMAEAERQIGRLELNADHPTPAKEHFREALRFNQDWAKATQNLPKARLNLLRTHQDLGEAYLWAHEDKAATDEFEIVRKGAGEASNDFPDRPDFAIVKVQALDKLGRIAEHSARLGEAKDFYEQSIKITRHFLAKAPDDRVLADSLIVDLNNLTSLAFLRQDLDEAMTLLAEESRIAEELARADPDSIDNQLRAVQIAGNLALVARAQVRYPILVENAELALSRLKKLEAAGKLRDRPEFGIHQMAFFERLAAFARNVTPAIEVEGGMDRIQNGGLGPRLTSELLFARLRNRARASDRPRLMEAYRALEKLDSKDIDESFEILALYASASTSFDENDPLNAPLMRESEAVVMTRLNQLVDRGFRGREKLMIDPRFRSLLNKPEFQAVLERIKSLK